MEVVEYQAAKLRLECADLDYLLNLVRSSGNKSADARILQSITPTRDSAIYEITPGPYVGRLGLPSGNWIDFRSRFPFEDVIELIRRSTRRPMLADTLRVDAQADSFLIDAIAIAYVREIRTLVSRGLAKGYAAVRYQRPPYPGRIDASYHVGRLAARPDQLATVARRLTTDVPENQALALALDVLSRVPLAREISAGLAGLAPAFGRVSRTPMRPDDVGRIQLTNLTGRYRHSLAIAEAILRSQSLAPRGAGLAGGSILFFMPKIWESYVADWLANQWLDHRIESPYRFPLTSDGQTAEADVTVWSGDQLVALYDAKYKWPNAAPERSDIYQMVTYSERLGLDLSTLIYPVDTPKRVVTVGSRTVAVLGLRPGSAERKPTPSSSPDGS